MKKNLTVFKIPAKALEDPELAEYIDSLMKDIAGSINKRQHISQLAKSLAQKDFVEVTTGQWARFAFLRQNLILFNQIVAESMAKKVEVDKNGETLDDDLDDHDKHDHRDRERLWTDKEFWEFVDTLLDQLHDDAEQRPTMELRKKEWEKNFTESLQDDLQMFPASDKNSSIRPSDGKSISDWQRAIHQELVW
ncbi:hypothetical protein EDC04DRAFT_3075497 [Pisolithus marmoratus]|nr:hypothetical protein EDC04DRAFT_3075497 [Pisolithus marmoratus]